MCSLFLVASQSMGGPPKQSGPLGQGAVCFSGPMHHLPFSLPFTAMRRERRLMPRQGIVQPLHSAHWPKTSDQATAHRIDMRSL